MSRIRILGLSLTLCKSGSTTTVLVCAFKWLGMFPQSADQKSISGEWHKFREQARRTTYSKDEFSDEEIIRYDLDTARITGRENPRSYKQQPTVDVLGEGGKDIRELPRHG